MKWYDLHDMFQDVAKDAAYEDFKGEYKREPTDDEWEEYLEECEFDSGGTVA